MRSTLLNKLFHITPKNNHWFIRSITTKDSQFNDLDNELKGKWQKSSTKFSDSRTSLAVHTCQTLEECVEESRQNTFKFDPKRQALDTLPKNEWRGFFQLMGQSAGFSYTSLHAFRSLFGAKSTSRQDFLNDVAHQNCKQDQEFLQTRVDALGPDLAAATFAIYRGARVRFCNDDKWYVKDKYDECELPAYQTPGWHLKEVDASAMTLYYPGLENFRNCDSLESFNFRGNQKVDNFFLDRLCYHFSDTLVNLDISFCPLITIGGITSLVRFKKLETLCVEGLNVPHLALACLMLEDEMPGLHITGINLSESGTSLSEEEIRQQQESLVCDKLMK